MATLTEIENNWAIEDLFDAHEILDTREAIMEEMNKKNK